MTHCLVNHHITGHLVFVLVSAEWVMMCPVIDNPTSCEIRAVIHFLQAKNMSAMEIHHELWVVYGQNVMSEGTVIQWCRMFKNGHTNVHDEDWSGQPSVVSDDLVESVDQKICEIRRLTISELLCGFPELPYILLYKIIIVRLCYQKFCARWVPKMLTGTHKMQKIASPLTF
jgi:hypothetical protein